METLKTTPQGEIEPFDIYNTDFSVHSAFFLKGGCVCVCVVRLGGVGILEPSVLSAQYCRESKTALKHKIC